MNAHELRIGNYILKNDKLHYCSWMTIRDIKTQSIEDADKFEHIPLTEEWLLKFGFTKQSTSNNCNKWFKGENPITHDWLFHLVWLVGHPTPFYQNGHHMIKYVHQLQNLFWCLCNEELTIKN